MCLVTASTPGPGTRPDLRAGLLDVLVEEAGAVGWSRACPRCGSGRHGRPLVRVAHGRPPHVSLAYTEGAAAVAWTTHTPVGVDLERRRARSNGAGPAAGEYGDLHTWTRTEALLKATGEGLARDPLGSDGLPDLWARRLDLGPDLVAAVALADPHLGSGPGEVEVRTEVREAPRRPTTR